MRRCKHAPVVFGLDLSLTGAAAVMLPADWDLSEYGVRSVLCGYALEKDATPQQRVARICDVTNAVVDFVESYMAPRMTHVFVEGYAYSARSSSVTQLAELGGAVRYELVRRLGITAVEMTASRARTYLLGQLPRGKGMQKPAVVHALRKCGFEFGSTDEYDALVVANAGLAEVGGSGLTFAMGDRSPIQ